MMYSFTPFPDTSIDHFGFYLVVICVAAVYIVWTYDYLFDRYSCSDPYKSVAWMFIGWTVISAIAITIAYKVSYGETPPRNEKVTAELVGFQPEGYRQQTNKNRHVDHHRMYVIYRVPGDGEVILRAEQDRSYPKYVTLYKK